MVQLTIDTNNDSVEELEHALHLVQQAISRRQPKAQHYEHQSYHEPTHVQHHEPQHHVSAPVPHAEPVRQEQARPVHQPSVAEAVQEADDAGFDAGFFKITLQNEHKEQNVVKEPEKVPTLNELLSESLNEEDLDKLFKEQQKYEQEHKVQRPESKPKEDAYIEIIEYNEEKN